MIMNDLEKEIQEIEKETQKDNKKNSKKNSKKKQEYIISNIKINKIDIEND